jgi:hypothetical protein
MIHKFIVYNDDYIMCKYICWHLFQNLVPPVLQHKDENMKLMIFTCCFVMVSNSVSQSEGKQTEDVREHVAEDSIYR